MAENIDFQFPMKKNCSTAIDKFCKNVPHGHARVIRCLQENMDNAAMPEQCKTEVAEYTAKTANDYRHVYPMPFLLAGMSMEKDVPSRIEGDWHSHVLSVLGLPFTDKFATAHRRCWRIDSR